MALPMEKFRDYISRLRRDFSRESLDEKTANADPFLQFEKWFIEAVESQVPDANAMTLATAGHQCRPSCRIVLLRDFSPEKGFVFYTNYNSRKGDEITLNPFVCLNFFWPQLERQVRINGKAEKQTTEESDLYFSSRPRDSQIGAWASPQSKTITNRTHIEERCKAVNESYKDVIIPRPEWWGGFKVMPYEIEFWQGRPSRLHDRLLYSFDFTANWKIERLAP